MKHKLLMIALVTIMAVEISAITAMLLQQQTATQAAPQPAAQFNAQTAINRIRTAEDMIERVTNTLAKASAACAKGRALAPRETEYCTTSINNLLPSLKIIRQVAANGDDVKWAAIIDVVHKLEADMEGHMSDMQIALRALGK